LAVADGDVLVDRDGRRHVVEARDNEVDAVPLVQDGQGRSAEVWVLPQGRLRVVGLNPKPRTYFRLEAVFSASQVEPLPPPAEPAALDPPIAELEGDSLAWACQPLEDLASELGYTVTYRTLAGARRLV
jgi:hypothetical protein